MQNINKNALVIINTLKKANFEAFLVGGCVRDLLLNKTPKDWDITTNATPDEVLKVFKSFSTFEIGKAFGVVSVVLDKEPFEIATFRTESYTQDSRCPSDVKFSSSIVEDLSRRDFKMNAIAFDPTTDKFVDPFGGQDDIKNKKLSFIGKVSDRLEEDELRLLRFFRFISQLSFNVDSAQMDMITDLAKTTLTFKTVSKERVWGELTKLFQGDNVTKAIDLMIKSGSFEIIVPEIKGIVTCEHNSPHHLESWGVYGNTVMAHTMHVLNEMECLVKEENVEKNRRVVLFLAALFHDIGKPLTETRKENGLSSFLGHELKSADMAKIILERLRFTKKEVSEVCNLIKQHMDFSSLEKSKNIAKLRRFFGRPNIEDLRLLVMADDRGSLNLEKVNTGKSSVKTFDEVWFPLRERFPDMLPKPIVTGKDILVFKLQGKSNSELLDKIYTNQLRGVSDKDTLLRIAKGMIDGLSK